MKDTFTLWGVQDLASDQVVGFFASRSTARRFVGLNSDYRVVKLECRIVQPQRKMSTCPDCPNDLVCHDQDECPRPTPETDAAIWHAKMPGNPLVADVVYASTAQQLERQRDKVREENARLREAAAVTQALAEWSKRYPRGVIYSASNRQMDAELIKLEELAKQAAEKLNIAIP